MSIAKITEITAESPESFEDAIRKGIERTSRTVKHITGAWVKEQKVVVNENRISHYRVDLKITFVLNE